MMASKFVLCRLCCSTDAIQNRRYKHLFSSKALKEDIPGRLSLALDLPVSDSDGLSDCLSFLYQEDRVHRGVQAPGQT